MTRLQQALIVIGSAVVFQLGTALAAFSAEDLVDWKRWAAGLLVGVANAAGIAIVAIKTSGGLALKS